jgi:hypothetical protein
MFSIAEIMKEKPPVHVTHALITTMVDSIGHELYVNRLEIYKKAIGFGLVGCLLAFALMSFVVGFFVALSVCAYALIVWVIGALCLP